MQAYLKVAALKGAQNQINLLMEKSQNGGNFSGKKDGLFFCLISSLVGSH